MDRKQSKKKHIPIRMCIICGRKAEKNTFFRFVLDRKRKVIFDPLNKLLGRGAYVCSRKDCVAKLLTKHGEKRLSKAFKKGIRPLGQKDIEALLAALEWQEGGTR